LRKPSVVAWLAKPTAEEIKMIDSLPPQDAARLRQALVVLASDELSRNVAKMPDTLNPTVARFLLGAGAAQESKKQTIEQFVKMLRNFKTTAVLHRRLLIRVPPRNKIRRRQALRK